jgi:2-hydroxychromene-2-carboxylate isomerase
MPRVTFYFDLGSPYAYLAAERLPSMLAEPVDWQPVLLGGLFKLTGRSSWALADHRRRRAGMAEIERRARAYALPPIRWPDPWPTDYLLAMRATMFAFARGRGREFSMEAFRTAFRAGRDLSVPGHVSEVAERCGLDRGEAEAAIADEEIKRALRAATDRAHALGVIGVPTIAIDDALFWGEDRLGDASAHLRGVAAAG